MGDILVGTASWADKSLLDSRLFYPKEAKTAEARLRYYSTQFHLVEVDSSYYAMPAPHVAELWAQRTPEASDSALRAMTNRSAGMLPAASCQIAPCRYDLARRPDVVRGVAAASIAGETAVPNPRCRPKNLANGRERNQDVRHLRGASHAPSPYRHPTLTTNRHEKSHQHKDALVAPRRVFRLVFPAPRVHALE